LSYLPLVIAVELVHEVAEYLTRKYPKTFRVASRHTVATLLRSPSAGEGCRSRFLSTSQEPLDLDEYSDWGWGGEPPIKTIRVEATRETFELPLNVKDGERAPERALEIAALLWVHLPFVICPLQVLIVWVYWQGSRRLGYHDRRCVFMPPQQVGSLNVGSFRSFSRDCPVMCPPRDVHAGTWLRHSFSDLGFLLFWF
jgi:hypothetical protein